MRALVPGSNYPSPVSYRLLTSYHHHVWRRGLSRPRFRRGFLTLACTDGWPTRRLDVRALWTSSATGGRHECCRGSHPQARRRFELRVVRCAGAELCMSLFSDERHPAAALSSTTRPTPAASTLAFTSPIRVPSTTTPTPTPRAVFGQMGERLHSRSMRLGVLTVALQSFRPY